MKHIILQTILMAGATWSLTSCNDFLNFRFFPPCKCGFCFDKRKEILQRFPKAIDIQFHTGPLIIHLTCRKKMLPHHTPLHELYLFRIRLCTYVQKMDHLLFIHNNTVWIHILITGISPGFMQTSQFLYNLIHPPKNLLFGNMWMILYPLHEKASFYFC